MLQVVKSETSPESQPDWEKVKQNDRDLEKKVTESTVILHITHFTIYGVSAEVSCDQPAAKLVDLMAFCPPVGIGMFLEPRVYCTNDYSRAEVTGSFSF